MGESELQFMPYIVQENYKKKVKEILSFSEEENNSIDRYQGNSVLLNELLGNYISDQAIIVPGMQYYTTKFSNNRETIERLMQDTQNLYSAMCKSSYGKQMEYKLFRGASRKVMPQAEQSFISTTMSQTEAVNWATLNNMKAPEHYLIELDVRKGVPFLYMPTKGLEDEVLISPFVDVETIAEGSRKENGTQVKTQKVRVKKRELNELSPEEMAKIQEEILRDADSMANLTAECIRAQREIKALELDISDYRYKINRRYQDLNANKISYADYKEFEKAYEQEKEEREKKLEGIIQELKDKRAPLENWKQKIRCVIEGRCREVELGLQTQIDNAMDQAREESFQLARAQAQREEAEREQERLNATTIRKNIEETKKLLINSQRVAGAINPLQYAIEWRNKLKQFQIPYESPTEKCLLAISRINYDCEYASNGIFERASQIVDLPKRLQEIQRVKPLESIELNEFARAVENLVVDIRIRQEERTLVNAKKNNQSQKVGLMGKLIGKEKKQQEIGGQIDVQIQQLRNFSAAIRSNGLAPDITYSVHDILAEIHIAKAKGCLTEQELAELEKYQGAIMKSFKIRQDRFEKMFYEKTHGNIESYDTRRFIEQYGAKIGNSQLRGRVLTTVEDMCYKFANQIDSDERWQKQRELNDSFKRKTFKEKSEI